MKKIFKAEDYEYPYFKVYDSARSSYRVTHIDWFYDTPDNMWCIVLHVSFMSLNKLHRFTKNNYFTLSFEDESVMKAVIYDMISEGEVHINEFPAEIKINFASNFIPVTKTR